MQNQNETNNILQKIYEKSKEKINQIILENKIQNKFRDDHNTYTLYIKDSIFIFKIYGYLLNNQIQIYGIHNIPKSSILVDDSSKEMYCITNITETDIVVKVDEQEYNRKGMLLNYEKNLEEVDVIKVGKKYYKYKS